jgi:predicted Zn finger-like uncharacterized protein
VFRITAEQLSLREGRVRCGQCQGVFDGRMYLVELRPQILARPEYELEEGFDPAKGPPTMTLRRPVGDSAASEGSAEAAAVEEETPLRLPGELAEAKRRLTRRELWAYGLAAVLLASLLVAQITYAYRDRLSAEYPELGDILRSACAPIGCSIGPPRESGRITIEASDLQADPARKGLLVLSATLRNRASFAVAYPHLELALQDVQGQVVARRVFGPAEYLTGKASAERGLPAGEEHYLTLYLDSGGVPAEGYKLEPFHP